MKKKCLVFLLALSCVFLQLHKTKAATYTSNQSGSWTNSAIWTPNGIPSLSDDVTIAAGHTVTLTASASINGLLLTGTLDLINSTNTITITGSGNEIFQTGGTIKNGNMIYNGTGAVTFNGGANFGTSSADACNVMISCAGGVSPINSVFWGFAYITSGGTIIISGCTFNGICNISSGADSFLFFSNSFAKQTTINAVGTISSGMGCCVGPFYDTFQDSVSFISSSSVGFALSSNAAVDTFYRSVTVVAPVVNFGNGSDSKIRFVGAHPQLISTGTVIPTFYNIEINKPTTDSTVKLFTDMNGIGFCCLNPFATLTLTAGVLDLNGHQLSFNNAGAALPVPYSTGGSTTAYITSTKTDFSGKVRLYSFHDFPGNDYVGTVYKIPFGVKIAGTDYYTPFSYTITTAGAIGAGANFVISTYGTNVTNCSNNRPLPPTVTDIKYSGLENSTYCVDRYWKVDLNNYTTRPFYTQSFGYASPESNTSQNTINEPGLKATRWNGSAWDWAGGMGAVNIASHAVTLTSMNSATETWVMHDNTHSIPFIRLSASSSTAVCSGTSTNLTAGGATAGTYTWNPAGSLNSSTAATVTATPLVTTNYTVTGSIPTGCRDTLIIVVTANSLPTINAGPDLVLCNGASTPINAQGSSGNYTWLPSAGLSATTGIAVNANSTVSGNHNYTVTVTDANNCNGRDGIVITVVPYLTPDAGPDVSICEGMSTVLTGSGGISYSWSPAVGLNVATGYNVTASLIFAGSYTYTLTATSGNCTGTDTVTITANPFPVIVLTGNSSICSGNNTSLFAVGAVLYAWAPSTNLSSTSGVSIDANPPTSINYTITGTDVNGCVNAATLNIIVTPTPTALISSNIPVCSGSSTPLTAGGAVSFTWLPGDGLNITSGPGVTADPTSTITYTVTAANGSCIDVEMVTVTVNALPTVDGGEDVTINYGFSTILSPMGNGTGYSWSPAEGLNCTNCQSPLSNPPSTITYYVTTTDVNGCTSSVDSVIVTVLACKDIFVADAFSPNGDGQNDVLLVNGLCITSIILDIYNRWGEKVFESIDLTKGWDGKYQNTDAPTGVYVYYLTTSSAHGEITPKQGNISLVR